MSKTTEQPPSPVQITLRGPGGAVFTFDLPLSEHVQRQYDRGELARCNPDGTVYTGAEWSPAVAGVLAEADAHGLDEYEQIVRAAEQEKTEAEALATALEDRIKDGDETVTPQALEEARSLRGFAKLRTEAAQRKAERAREAERQRQLRTLRTEMKERPGLDHKHLADLLRTAEEALSAFVATAKGHNAQVMTWYERMLALQVPELKHPAPPAEHARLGWRANHIGPTLLMDYPIIQIDQISPDHLLAGLLDRVTAQHQLGQVTGIPGSDPYEVLDQA